MKIYPSAHNIVETDSITPFDIPLAYLDTEAAQPDVVVEIEQDFAAAKDELAMPYDTFDKEPVLFDSYGNRIDVNLKRDGAKWVYVPPNVIEFTPKWFGFTVLYKRNAKYHSDRTYNISVGVSGATLDFSKKIITIFGDAPRRGLCPANIIVNDGSTTLESTFDKSIEECDFIFVESPDGVHIDVDGTLTPLDIDKLLTSNTNVWLSVNSFGSLIEQKDNNIYEFLATNLYDNKTYALTNYNYAFNLNGEFAPYLKDSYSYINIFNGDCPVLILEKPNNGYLIISHATLFDDLSGNSKAIYEILMHIYLSAYKKTAQESSWITDAPIDYMYNTNISHGLCHKKLNIKKLIEKTEPKFEECLILDVQSDTSDVMFGGINSVNDLLFVKTGSQKDRTKPDGFISLYTTNNSVVFFKIGVIRKLETGFTYNFIAPQKTIIANALKSTKHGIDVGAQAFTITNWSGAYVLCVKENTYRLVLEQVYTQDDGIKIATIKPIYKAATSISDMRVLGGGLPANEKLTTYSLLDVGNINGRPYRAGSVMVIRLPKKLEQYREIITDAIKQHCAAGDYPVVIFE